MLKRIAWEGVRMEIQTGRNLDSELTFGNCRGAAKYGESGDKSGSRRCAWHGVSVPNSVSKRDCAATDITSWGGGGE